MMDYSASRLGESVHPNIRHLSIRNISKIITSRIIMRTQLQLQYYTVFCKQLGVPTHLNTHTALAYFIDNCYMDRYGVNPIQPISFAEVYNILLNDFYDSLGYISD
jgi:hypothetical protein